jgi:methionyl-tRNA synthetase
MAMVERYCSGFVPSAPATALDVADHEDYAAYHSAMLANLPNKALDSVWATVSRGNEYVDRQAPWKLAKDPAQRAELDSTLASLIRSLARQALALAPFMPGKSAELLRQLGAPAQLRFGFAEEINVAGWRVMKGEPLFPKPLPGTSDG